MYKPSVLSINFSGKKIRFLLFWIYDTVALTQFRKLMSFVFNICCFVSETAHI